MNTVRLAIDVESGDYGPSVIISGIMEARLESAVPFEAFLCGDREAIERVLTEKNAVPGRDGFFIEHCSERIGTDDKKTRVWKTRTGSSIVRAITLQREGKVQASISAGDTGILMGAALFILGRMESVSRPALAAFLPTLKKHPVLLLDVGANLNCRSEHLVSFGMMGVEYVRRLFDKEIPTVSLLNIGKERTKGTRAIDEAGKELERKLKGYSGFIEGNGVLSGEVDIVVCDGFAGNVLLKACESFHGLIQSVLGTTPELIDVMKKRMAALDPDTYGAVPLLGIRGNVLKAHGGSSSKAIASAVRTAIATVGKVPLSTHKSER